MNVSIEETIISEGLYLRHLYRVFEEVRQFVFECILSLINVLLVSLQFYILFYLFPPEDFSLRQLLRNWLFWIFTFNVSYILKWKSMTSHFCSAIVLRMVWLLFVFSYDYISNNYIRSFILQLSYNSAKMS